jgi:hypothetical protein
MTCGLAPAATYGTHLTPGEFAQPACTSGLQPSAARVSGGRRIRIGTSNDRISNAPFYRLHSLPVSELARPSDSTN